jgi:general secretion pathway protein E
VRQLCERCKRRHILTHADLDADPRYGALDLQLGEEVCEPGHCEHCGGTGYRGRIGVFEVLDVNESVRNLITSQSDAASLDKAAVQCGMTTMIQDGAAKCRAGVTSAAEVLRVTTIR